MICKHYMERGCELGYGSLGSEDDPCSEGTDKRCTDYVGVNKTIHNIKIWWYVRGERKRWKKWDKQRRSK